jgi:protein translocase SecG subunit
MLKVVHMLLCFVVVFGVLFMNQKSEGLSGIMGGMSQSMRGVKGMDEGMRKFITWVGAGLFASAILLGVVGI